MTALAGAGPLAGLVRLWRRLSFRAGKRAEVWQLLSDVLEGSGEDLGRMMDAVADGYALQGQRTIAAVLGEIRSGLGEGRLPERLSIYGGMGERILFFGITQQPPGVVFGSAARLLRSQMSMRKAIVAALVMPVVLTCGFLGLVLFFGLSLLPALSQAVTLDTLPGFQGWVVRATLAFAADPTVLALWLGGGTAVVVLAMRYWTGFGRQYLDRVPPFSLMRLSAGAGFLFAVVEFGRTNQAITTELLERMGRASPPYARSRILALAKAYIPAEGNLGDAGVMAGQGFPALELTAVLRTLWNRKGGIARIGDVLERWLSRIEDTVRARMAILNAVLLALISFALLALMSIALPIIEQINRGTAL